MRPEKIMDKNIKDGYGRFLGHLEQEILDTLWSRGEATGKEIFDRIRRTRGIALTTALTVLERLTKKGLVSKIKGDSVYIYRPAYTKDEFAGKISKEVFKGIFDISTSGASASFVDVLGNADPDELDRLSSLIEQKKKELRKR